MKPTPSGPGRRLLALALIACGGASATFGQSAAAPGLSEAKDAIVQLDPFQTTADSDTSYGAINSNSITRFSAELNKLPLTADIFDQAFMQDTAADSIEGLIQGYSAGAGFSAGDAAGAGSTGGSTAQPGDHVSHGYTELRGFDTPRPERDSLMPVGSLFNPGSTAPNYTSTFDVERVEVIDGPQALLYSGGGAGGVINVVSKPARLGQPSFGSAQFQVDQYGSKKATFDFGASAGDNFAVRFATVDQSQATRRLFIGSNLEGYYGQVAMRLFGTTIIRIEAEQTTHKAIIGNVTDFLSGSTTADSRDDDQLRYLLASGNAGDTNPATGQPYGPKANAIDNGLLNWSNVDSAIGWQASQATVDTFETLTAETRWNPWLTTELAMGYNTVKYDIALPLVLDYFAPEDTSSTPNPLGVWAIGLQPADQEEDGRTKGIRFDAVLNPEIAGGKVKSQTILGGDFVRSDAMDVEYSYYQADGNFNALVNPATLATNNGRTLIGKQYWSIANGLIQYPLFAPGTPQVTLGGVNYVRQIQNEVNPALVSPSNPLGLTNTNTYEVAKLFNKGLFLVNYSQWLNGRLATMAGVRLAESFDEGLILSGPLLAKSDSANYDLGVNYALVPALRAYASVSSSYEPPQTVGNHDPAGQVPTSGRSAGQEAGLKYADSAGRLSGSLSVFHTRSKNEQYEISSTLVNDINPTGLNGVGVSGQWVDLDRTTIGAQLLLTANPVPNWRIRFSAADTKGTILDTKAYGQLYNDQFHENASGQVTYADGTVVFVNPTYNSKTPVATATTAGAIPLTVALMNTASSPYYAAAVNPTGAISATSAVATVLKTVDPAHGAILTGALGLPISALQITPSFAVPGSVAVAVKGDRTVGYPQYSMNLTQVYTFRSGWTRGFELGGTLGASWKYGDYYYYPQGFTSVSPPRALFSAPTVARVDLISGYTHKFKRVSWITQLNVNNLFNHYHVLILPNEITGYATASNLNATFFGQPRSFIWTNTVKF